jgi:hypothetical protein
VVPCPWARSVGFMSTRLIQGSPHLGEDGVAGESEIPPARGYLPPPIAGASL